MVCKHGDKYVCVYPVFFLMIDRLQTMIAPEIPESPLYSRQHYGEPPYLLFR